ncbi:MAG: hypothetical protein H2B05_06580 [Nitrosopumilaceae archaeon]|uniref:Uncharacterized protein n=1 Tax=Candidatus Nitrosomaritimum aestuariumsis TaxID=3342354 RepID=A0AC60W4I7_9ARCH|nr:hypothetical protein [Nitrosopumilaceae archaeon]
MKFDELISQNNWKNYPVGLSGCRTTNSSLEICDYDLTVFDDSSPNVEIVQHKNDFVKIHHGSLSETQSKILIQYDGMQIIQDESWDLRMFLSKIKEKRIILYKDHAKNSLLESIFCCEKAKQGIKDSSIFATCWQKSASFFLADGIVALNHMKPGSCHMLDVMRKFEKNPINEKISVVNETVGIERATPSLLERMLKSTIGFSEMVNGIDSSTLIQRKHDYFISNSMLSDCYFYLGYTTKENFVKLKDSIEKNPDYIHVLKIAFDIEADLNLLQQQANLVHQSSNEILEYVARL